VNSPVNRRRQFVHQINREQPRLSATVLLGITWEASLETLALIPIWLNQML
jgi:hypothetical protein